MTSKTVRLSLLLLLTAALTPESLHQQLPVSQQLQQLQRLLAPVLQQAALWAQPEALTQLVRLQLAIEQLQLSHQNTTSGSHPPEPEQPEPAACKQQPGPQSGAAAPARIPSTRACARSCLQLRDQASDPLQDGVYWLTGLAMPVYCDFSHDGGGWTLLLTVASKKGWDVLSALERNKNSPSLTDNYSILRHADGIRDLGRGERFAYRIEAQAETGRGRWGGIWVAPRSYSFVHEANTQTDVKLVRRFDKWAYKDNGIEKAMPWFNIDGFDQGTSYIVTTSTKGHWWGTLVTHEWEPSHEISPWISPEASRSGTILYWMREETV